MENEKDNKSIVILLTILIILVIALAVYIVCQDIIDFSKCDNTVISNNTNNKDSNHQVDVSDALIERLYNKISSPYNANYAEGLSKNSEISKFYYALNNVPNTQFISNIYPCNLVATKPEAGFVCGINDTTSAIAKNDLLTQYKELFGTSLSNLNEVYYENNKLIYYIYDGGTDKFIRFFRADLEGLTDNVPNVFMIDYEIENNNIIINQKVEYSKDFIDSNYSDKILKYTFMYNSNIGDYIIDNVEIQNQ